MRWCSPTHGQRRSAQRGVRSGCSRHDPEVEAFEAIESTLPLGSVSFENKTNEHGERLIWLEPRVVDRLRARAAVAKATPT